MKKDKRLDCCKQLVNTWKKQLGHDCDQKGRSTNYHSLQNQFQGVINYNILYNTLIESISENESNREANCSHNPLLSYLLSHGFAAHQLIGIRRIIGSERDSDVISLRRLINNIESNLGSFTREYFLKTHGGTDIPFDYTEDKIQADLEFVQRLENAVDERGRATLLRPEEPWMVAKMLHEKFDEICGTSEPYKKTDKVPPKYIEEIKNKLDEVSSLTETATNFFAHASEPKAIEKKVLKDISIQVDDINKALKTIFYCMQRLSLICDEVHPDPVFSYYPESLNKSLDLPFFLKEIKDEIPNKIKRIEQDMENWRI